MDCLIDKRRIRCIIPKAPDLFVVGGFVFVVHCEKGWHQKRTLHRYYKTEISDGV